MLYGYMQGIYSTRKLAKARGRNINIMRLLNGNAPPSHGMPHVFRKHILGAAIEEVFYELVRFLGRSGGLRFEDCFIEGAMVGASGNRDTAVWRKNLDRYEGVRHEAVLGMETG
jgi:transposase